MSFLGAGFLAGLFAIGLPLAIHLFAKRKRVHIQWGAMRFLAESKPDWRKRTLRLQDWLVLLMRIIAVALLVLAFARPLIKRPAPAPSGEEFLLIVDRSASTALGEGAVAKQIDQRVEELLEHLPEDARLRFLVSGTGPNLRELVAKEDDALNHSRNRADWLAALNNLTPGIDNPDWAAAVDEALSYPMLTLDSGPGAESRQVIVVADAAIHGWPYVDISDQQAISEAWDIGSSPIALLPVGADHSGRQRSNLCVDRIEADRQRVTPGEDAVVRATVTNRGTVVSAETTARWRGHTNASSITEASIPPLEPGAAHEMVLRRAFPNAGPQSIELIIDSGANEEDDDALPGDNHAALVVEIVDRLQVIAVSDEAPGQVADEDRRFADWAFTAATGPGDEGSVFKLETVKINAFADHSLKSIAVVVWSAGDRDRAAVEHASPKLHSFVSGGGGLWLMPPVDSDLDKFNEVFFPHDFGISPAALDGSTTAKTADEQRIGLRPVTSEEKLQRLGLSTLTELQVGRHFLLREPMPPSTVVAAEFEGGHPFLVTRRLGRGSVALTTLNGHPRWSNLAACPGYVPFVRELLWHLAADRLPERNLAGGEPGRWRELQNNDSVRIPDGEWLSAEAVADDYSVLAAPGLYLIESATDGSHSPFTVGRVAEESDIRPAPSAYFETLANLDGLSVIDPGNLAAAFSSETGEFEDQASPALREEEITPWLLIALVGFLVFEVVTAQHLIQRRRRASGATPVK